MLDGTVSFADELGGDDYVLGVLGHELGHATQKHPTRLLLEGLQLGMVGGLVWGDFSSTAAALPALFARLNNSRAFEQDADAFAVKTLRAAQLSADPLYRFFDCLSQSGGVRTAELPSFMSTHPATEARLARLRAFGADVSTGRLACPPASVRSQRSPSK
jgi:predicted Zn-dependent protease